MLQGLKHTTVMILSIVLVGGGLFGHSQKVYAADDETAKDTYLSKEIVSYCEKYGREYNIAPEIIEALIERESAGKADAVNGSCKGLMQVSEKWHKDRMEKLGITDLYDAESNIHVGVDYLAQLLEECENDMGYALMVYNGFSKAATYHAENKISKYAAWILKRYEEIVEAKQTQPPVKNEVLTFPVSAFFCKNTSFENKLHIQKRKTKLV